ncbi:MAG TPA: hypothetical protein VFS05_05935 [Gemmatimonadaceae bacterium]|nr:hypothetical protein [Gemmatimonadaceae bacterium]
MRPRPPIHGRRTPRASGARPLLAPALLALLAPIAAGCREEPRPTQTAGAITVTTSELGAVHRVGADTLGDSARITRLVPEPDGDAVVFTVADPARGITAALAILAREGNGAAQLVWPDSVTRFWWSGPHRLAFEAASGQGVHVVVNVHAASLAPVASARDSVPPAPRVDEWLGAANRARATAYIDSVRVQPEGEPQESALRYTVTSAVPAPADSLVAFHVIARGSESANGGADGGRMNPAWYILDARTRAVTPVDSITGRAEAMPEGAAGWAEGRFFYVKGEGVWEARVRRP